MLKYMSLNSIIFKTKKSCKKMKVLQIETTNYCNSQCIFCTHNKIKKIGVMSNKLFEKILIDAKEIKTLEILIPMLNGEPFSDKGILTKLKLINKILPGKKIILYTNGSFLNEEILSELKEIKDITINFSLNGNCKETRKRLMGLEDYEHVVKMISIYSKFGKPYQISFVADPSINVKELFEFSQKWGEHAQLLKHANFAGENFDTLGPKLNCIRAIEHMTVLYNGEVNLCCMDSPAKIIFGNLKKQSVKEIWESEKRQRYVKGHLNNEIMDICDNCTGA